MIKKKILIFIDWFYPGYKAGGPISSNVNMLVHLKDDYQFKIITRNTDYTDTTPYKDIVSNQWAKGIEDAELFYFSKENLSFKSLKELLRSTEFDVAYINGIYSWYFSILPLWLLGGKNKKIIVCARGMLSSHALGVKSLKKLVYLYLAWAMGFFVDVTFHATNEKEREEIKKLFGKSNIKVAPNFPRKIEDVSFKDKIKIKGSIKLINIARIAPEKNTLYLLEILSSLTNPEINIELDLFGSIYNQDYWNSCLELIEKLPTNIKVNYKGALPSGAVMQELSQNHFMFMPTRGENYGHTIIESLSAGCPVIISDQTPWRKLKEVQNSKFKVENQESQIKNHKSKITNQESSISVGWDIPLSNPSEFIEVIEHCAAMNQDEYDQMSRNAFEYAQSIINNPETLESNRRLFEE
jgi:glycosyltransferase involved in cell wall biosynthesis